MPARNCATNSKRNIQYLARRHMIQRVKLPATYPLFGRYRARPGDLRALTSEQAEEHLDDLVRHALNAAPQHDGNRIWQQITRKVLGPFGTPAFEAPAQSSL